MIPEATLFMGCCRGGMKTVALKLLKECDKIDYICGPSWNTKGRDLVTAFTTFSLNRLSNGEEPAIAAERASKATGQTFICYDRQELEAEIELLRRIERIESVQFDILRGQQDILDEIRNLWCMDTGLKTTIVPNSYFPEDDGGCRPCEG